MGRDSIRQHGGWRGCPKAGDETNISTSVLQEFNVATYSAEPLGADRPPPASSSIHRQTVAMREARRRQ